MFPFKRKNSKEVEQVEEKTKRKKRSRKKKEPKKTWGKKERLLVFVILIITVASSAILGLYARDWKLPGLPRLSLEELSLPFLSEETIIIEKNIMSKEASGLFKDKTNKLSGVWGLYVYNLGELSSYGVNENTIFQAASFIKLPVMVTMYKEAEAGNLDLSQIYKLKAQDKREGSGHLYNEPVGTEISYRNLIRLMGQESDNTAFRATVNILGEEKVIEAIKSLGMEKTSYENNSTSPKDMGDLFVKIWNGELLSEQHSDELLSFLTNTVYENHLPAGMPEGIVVAHKYGREEHVVNDAGIVFSKEPFVSVIMSRGVVEADADSIFPELARDIYNFQAKN